MVSIAEIEHGSIAEELRLKIGTRIVRVNGEKVRDGIDLTFLLAEAELELETVDPAGTRTIFEIAREPGEPLGIVPAPDKVRECANECVFCFIDGNPDGVRPSLWIRDDDFRLSFTYGSYVTLTNLGPRGLERLVEQRLSPLYVSVHATDPEVRIRLLKNERAGLIMDHLRYLTGHGLDVHTQVVLCPEWNDGAHLDRTLRDLYDLGDGIRTLSVVPVGLTKYNINRPVRPLMEGEAGAAVDQVDRFRERALAERGYGWCYSADELVLAAGRRIPDESYYDDGSLMENGVGSVRRFLDDMDRGIDDLGPMDSERILILTGTSMAPFLRDRASGIGEAVCARVEVSAVENRFYGESVTVAGLLGGEDLLEAAAAFEPGGKDVVLLPAETLNQDDLFIDSFSLEEFRRELAPARVVPAYEVTEALGAL